jgi:Ulp1 family protease
VEDRASILLCGDGKGPQFLQLEGSQLQQITDIWKTKDLARVIAYSPDGEEITVKDIQTLCDKNWLNSKVMNAFLLHMMATANSQANLFYALETYN